MELEDAVGKARLGQRRYLKDIPRNPERNYDTPKQEIHVVKLWWSIP